MNQHWVQSRWWRYCLMSAGTAILLGYLGFFAAFELSSMTQFLSLALIGLAGISLILAGSAVTDQEDMDQIRQVPFIGLSLLLFGAALLAFPVTDALTLSFEWTDTHLWVSGVGMSLIGLGQMIWPESFAKETGFAGNSTN